MCKNNLCDKHAGKGNCIMCEGERGIDKTYSVYFNQINQTKFKIVAKSKEEAVIKAINKWKEEYGNPEVLEVERGEINE